MMLLGKICARVFIGMGVFALWVLPMYYVKKRRC
jgi:hypothetical protein